MTRKDALKLIFSIRSLMGLLAANFIVLIIFVAMALCAPPLIASPGEEQPLTVHFLNYSRLAVSMGFAGTVFIALPSLFCFLRKDKMEVNVYQREAFFWSLCFSFGFSLLFCLWGPSNADSLGLQAFFMLFIFLFLTPIVFVATELSARIYWWIVFRAEVSQMRASATWVWGALWAFISFVGAALIKN